MSLTSDLKQIATMQGISLVGVAPVERFAGAPAGHGPRDFVHKAESVVVLGLKLPEAIVDRHGYLADAVEYAPAVRKKILDVHIYQKQGYALPNLMLDEVAYRLSLWLEGQGHRALPFPATPASYTMPDITTEELGYFGVFSHRHAAVRAGLGEFGYNNIVVTKDFGPRVRFTSIVTTASLDASPLVSEPICLRDDCLRCLEACPSKAITLLPEIPDGIFLDPPSRTYVRGCVDRPAGSSQGTCLAVCPLGDARPAA